ncbi:hypothetical protein N5D48_14675 [Pseudomonas sp. GD03858]|uniref:hypothetical protein n=1 Tax=unclassified Pseudomonas TaxID=196821 RepID=UPI0024495783|nr:MULTISPECIES: hypothetical protein [unclassified Pseudomonas]MDH0646514.1 hypothetical protein [Pseudomonas sp. GD03867]MDH0663653.1 hypothetical protein [Pseudomonas sp. GD03858]
MKRRNIRMLFATLLACQVGPGMAAEWNAAAAAPKLDKFFSLAKLDTNDVDRWTGGLRLKYVDVSIPGPAGMDIEVVRSYDSNSLSTNSTTTYLQSFNWAALGPGWRLSSSPRIYSENNFSILWQPATNQYRGANYHNVGLHMLCSGAAVPSGASEGNANSTQNTIFIETPNGDVERLYLAGNYTAYSKGNWKATCTGGNLSAYSPDGRHYSFGAFSNSKIGRVFYNNLDRILTGPDRMPTEPPVKTITYLDALSATDASGNTLTFTYKDLGKPIPKWPIPGVSKYPTFEGISGERPSYFELPTSVLTSIKSSDGRSLELSYDSTTGRLLSMVDQQGNTWSYAYSADSASASSALSKVTLPGGEYSWSYTYYGGAYQFALSDQRNTVTPINPLNTDTISRRKLSSVRNPLGGVTSYTYGHQYFSTNSHTKTNVYVAKKELSDGSVWQYSYTRGGVGAYDTTTIKGPAGTEVYQFYGFGYVADAPSGFENNLWRVGLPVSITRGDRYSETYTYQKRVFLDKTLNMMELGFFLDEKVWAGDIESRSINADGALFTTRYTNYDEYGKPGVKVETGPGGGTRTTTYTYHNDPSKWIIGKPKSENSQAGASSWSYDASGRMLSETRDGVTTSYTYDGLGNLASKTLPGNHVHSYSNYKRGISQTEVQPEGVTLTRVVDDGGNVTALTNGEGKTTRFTYDGLRRVTAETPPLGNAEITTYAATSKTIARGNLLEVVQYDPFGRVASVALGGITTRYAYDGLGRRTFVSDPGATTGTHYQYDVLGRVIRVTNADNSYKTIAYGAATRAITDERGKTTTETYRGYGNPNQSQLMAISAPEPSANIVLTRDAANRVTSVTQGGLTRTYGYNANGYLTSTSNPETGQTVYGRDAAGNMISKQVGASGITRYGHDGQNRLKSVIYPGTTPAVSNTYDKTGKLLASTSSGGNRTMAYDAAGNLLQQSLTLDGKTFTASYGYNANNQLASITYPQSARVVNYAPDALGRPTMVSGYVSNVSYWPSGMINQITYANGTTTTYTQTPRLWPATFATAKTGGATYGSSAYTYDSTGNLTTIHDALDSSFNRTLDYDGINRLTGAAGYWGAGSISYDGVGNLLKQTYGATSLNYAYDAQNRLASVSGQRAGGFAYDAYGNIASSAGTTYTYDDVPNLVCINCAVAASKVEYQYDAANQRSSVTKAGRKVYEMHDIDGKQLIELDGATLTEYIYLGDKRIAERVSP